MPCIADTVKLFLNMFNTAPCVILIAMLKFFSALLAAALLAGQSPESALTQAIDSDAPAAVELLERLVNQNSGTFNSAGVRAVAAIMERELSALGFETRLISLDAINRGAHLVAIRKGAGKSILLIGHMDTVFEPASPFHDDEPESV